MKRYTVTLIASLVVALVGLLAGCTNERLLEQGSVPDPVGPGQYVTFGVRVGLDTYSVPAEDYEKAVESVQALLFDADGKYLATPTLKPIPGKSAEYGFQCRETGSLKMLLVANHTFTASDLQGKTLTEVGKLLVNKTEPGTANEFVMASDAKDLTITAGQETKAGTIALTRLAARIDIQTTLDKLVLTKVTMKGRKVQSTLLASADTKAHTSATKVYDTFTVFGKKSSSASMGQIYGFENTQAGSEPGGTTLEIEATFDGLKIKPVTVKLPALQRNHIYSLQLINDKKEYDPTKDKLTYVLTVLDWNAGPVLRLTEKELQRIMADQLAGTSYTISVTSEASKGTFLSADGFTASVIPVVTKKVEVKGVTISSEEIKGQDKFTYKLKYATLGTDYVTIDAQGQYVVQSNPTYSNRRFAFDVVWKDSPDKANPVRMEYILEQSGQPISTAPDGVLSLMAEHNVKSDGTWDKDFTIPTSKDDRTYLMDWHAAMALDMPSGYHLPSREELQSIFPWGGSCVLFDKAGETNPATISDRSATVSEGDKAKVGDETFSEVKSQFAYKPGVIYALRFIGTKHESAWQYEYVKEGGKQMFRITSIGLKDFNGTVLDVMQHALMFESGDATERFLPAAGFSGGNQGTFGYYWSSTENSSLDGVAYRACFQHYAGVGAVDESYASSVRPFVGEPKVRFQTKKDRVLSRMAEHNVKSDGTWDKDHTIPTSKDDRTYLMDWEKAMALDMPSGYHLPSQEELQSIFPNEHSCVCFDKKTGETNPASITDRSATVSEGEKAKVGDETVTEVKSQFAYEPNVTYALRYIGTKHESAWKYEYVKVGGKQMLRITSIGLKDFNGTVLDVRARSKTLFASSDATVRLLPAAGDSDGKQGSVGSFYASTEQGGGVFHAAIYGSHATMGYGFKVVARSVRPFVGAQKVSFETQKDRVLSRMAEQNLCYTSSGDLGFSRDYSIPKIDDVWQVATNFMTYDQLMLPDFPTLPSGYHLPSREEMQSIIPSGATYVLFNGKADVTYPSNITGPGDGVLEVLEPDDEAQVYGYDGGLCVKSQFAYETGVTYALRYVGTPLESAWRYQILEDNGVPVLAISSVCLKNFHGTVLDVKKNADRLFIDEMRVVRWLPLAGYSRGEQRTHGYFWTATGVLNNPEEAYCFYVNRGTYSAVQSEKKVTAFSVRLFADTPLGK